MKKISLIYDENGLLDGVSIKERKNPWINPRKTKVVKGYVRLTKKGVSYINPFTREYPHAIKQNKKENRRLNSITDAINKHKEEKDVAKKEALDDLKNCLL